jgi:hypothetical protein
MELTSCCSRLVTEEPGLAARDGLEVSILRGWRQALSSGSQECIEVLQPCNLKGRGVTQQVRFVKQIQLVRHKGSHF